MRPTGLPPADISKKTRTGIFLSFEKFRVKTENVWKFGEKLLEAMSSSGEEAC